MKGFFLGLLTSVLVACGAGMTQQDIVDVNHGFDEIRGGLKILANAAIELSERLSVVEKKLGIKAPAAKKAQ